MTENRAHEHHPAFEEYCVTIFELGEDHIDVIQARIADRLGYSRPSVSEMIRKMQAEGLVTANNSTIGLTVRGRGLAEQVVRRHRLAERFLTDVLGLSWAEAHLEAGRWEHVMSDVVEKAMSRMLGNPTTCPHGNPIPGAGHRPDDGLVPICAIAIDAPFTVVRITEELEFAPGMLEFLETSRLVPGQHGTVAAVAPDGSPTVVVAGRLIALGRFAGERIMVAAT